LVERAWTLPGRTIFSFSLFAIFCATQNLRSGRRAPRDSSAVAERIQHCFNGGQLLLMNFFSQLVPDLAVNMISFLPISPEQYERFQTATVEDPNLQTLQGIVKSGWPNTKDKISSSIRTYWPFRDEICSIDGLLYKGHSDCTKNHAIWNARTYTQLTLGSSKV
jgi:hypothetical protein